MINLDEMPPSLVPDDLVDEMRALPAVLTETERYRVARLVEYAFHRGFGDGYARGAADGEDSAHRAEEAQRGAHVAPKPYAPTPIGWPDQTPAFAQLPADVEHTEPR